MDWITILGYSASVITLCSLLMKSLLKLRWINAVGASLFSAFAILTASWPTAFLNMGIVLVDIYFIRQLMSRRELFELIPVQEQNEMIQYFYRANEAEIRRIFGDAAFNSATEYAFYMKNNDIAGILAYSDSLEGKVRIQVDYVTPRYRDFSIGRYFYITDLSFWKNKQVSLIEMEAPSKEHIPYLKKAGFIPKEDSSSCGQKWIKQILSISG
ncbi:MAG: hypothetical protein LBU99_06930 [Spirochaetaceae bacterium]|jgi:hypothetical protein|nr:hypothetical protein [Spirochaetaceae bacterium]